MKKVSILIPYYGHEAFVQHTLDSVLADSYPSKQIVIINDGSPDDGDRIIREWIATNGNRIEILYRNRENRGLNATLNELIDLSDGDYILLMDSDDMLLEGGIEKRVAFLEKHPRFKAVFADATVVDREGNRIYESMLFDFRGYARGDFADPQQLTKTLLRKFVLAGPIHLVRREIYDEVGMYDEGMVAEDFDFTIRAMAKGYYAFLDEKVCAYRVHDENLTVDNVSMGFVRVLADARRSLLKNASLFPASIQGYIYYKAFLFLLREKLMFLRVALQKELS